MALSKKQLRKQNRKSEPGGHGRPKHRSGQSNREGTRCQVGKVIYHKREDAERASKRGRAKRCGRCRNWHPED